MLDKLPGYGIIVAMKNYLISVPHLPKPVVSASVQAENLDAFDNSDGFATSANFTDGCPLDARQLDIFTDSKEGALFLQELACNSF